jgi:glc operon protein GlcG
MAAAEAKAKQNNWNCYLDCRQWRSYGDAAAPRRHAAGFHSHRGWQGPHRGRVRRPTKALEDVIAGGGAGLRYFTVPGVNLMEGGVPIVIDGKIVGGIGVSGVDSKDDAQIAQAGAAAVR